MEYTALIHEKALRVLQGDITAQDTDAIVNAANNMLLGGGGVDGAIHRAAGPELLEACREVKRTVLQGSGGLLPTGEAVITGGFGLKANSVIHTVGPIYSSVNNPEELLANAYRNSLLTAASHGIRSIAFPSIGTGVYGCPLEWAAEIALKTIRSFLEQGDTTVRHVRMVLFSNHDYEVYRRTLTRLVNSK